MGLFPRESPVLAEQQALKAANSELSDTAVNALIDASKSRSEHDFAAADKIRDDLTAQGIVLEDGAGGTSWRRK